MTVLVTQLDTSIRQIVSFCPRLFFLQLADTFEEALQSRAIYLQVLQQCDEKYFF